MSLTRGPVAALSWPPAYQWDVPAASLSSYTPMAAEADDANTISIYDIIGEDWWTGGGFTAARCAAALRKIGANPVTVNINSPGGDMFEGLAIYNMLAEHPAKVTVKIMGLAASAASAIAMAGDEVLMGTGSMIMIHRAWGLAVGNHHAFADAADLFAKFDDLQVDIYAERTGLPREEIMAMLDGATKASDGTFMSAAEAIEKGFADGKFDKAAATKAQAELPSDIVALRRVESALAKQGMSRRERNALLKDIRGAREAAPATRDAGEDETNVAAIRAALTSNLSILRR